ncbi:hypothetical protein pdam_00018653 [Pocillopora damicornis]|uniref:Uncharacterized protein n=1 Tax=Pocillopora damicornis TaxID=46731 RepID=A0A3M6U248_POCDA|nr:hypothetical protein pdam_00018653 [Pocillopora damicornis]
MSGDLGYSKHQVSMYLSYTLVSGVRRRCKDIAKNGASTSGRNGIFNAMLNSEPGFVSALMQSFSLGKKANFAMTQSNDEMEWTL